MATHYTLPNFVRQASNRLLAEYFNSRGIDLGIDVGAVKPRQSDKIAAVVDGLDDEQRAALNWDFLEVTGLADKAGAIRLLNEARFREIDLADALQGQNGYVNKAFWTFLHHRAVFDGAARLATPHLNGRFWKRRLPVTAAPGIELRDRAPVLEDALRTHFRKVEGRGRACKVEYEVRPPLHYFHAYPEDFSAAPLAWTGQTLAPHPYRPAFDVVFVYNDTEGTLDIYFEGDKPAVERLWKLFAHVVLGIAELPERVQSAFGIERLKAAHAAFIRPPDSPIVDLRVKRLAFRVIGGDAGVVSVETDVSRDPHAIHAMVDKVFTRGVPVPGRYSLSQAKVIGARVQATIDPGDGGRRCTRSFDLTERTCTLKYDEIDTLLRQVLLDSGIDLTGRTSDANHDAARPVAEQAAE